MARREQLKQCLVLVLDGFCCFQKGRAVFLSYLNNHFTYFGYVVDLQTNIDVISYKAVAMISLPLDICPLESAL